MRTLSVKITRLKCSFHMLTLMLLNRKVDILIEVTASVNLTRARAIEDTMGNAVGGLTNAGKKRI